MSDAEDLEADFGGAPVAAGLAGLAALAGLTTADREPVPAVGAT